MTKRYDFTGNVTYVARALDLNDVDIGQTVSGYFVFDDTRPDDRPTFGQEGRYLDVVNEFEFNIHDAHPGNEVVLHKMTLLKTEGTVLNIKVDENDYVYFVDNMLEAPSINATRPDGEFNFRLQFPDRRTSLTTSIAVAPAISSTYLSRTWEVRFVTPTGGLDKIEGYIF